MKRICIDPLTENELHTGWNVNGVYIHPVYAYSSRLNWFEDFLAKFPEKEKRMRKFSEQQGWTNAVFAKYWVPAVIRWLNHNYT